MANYTPQQLQQMNSMLAGTFDRLDTAPKSQPGYTMDQIYGGILPSASPAYSKSRWGAGAIPINALGTEDGSVLFGKDQATFAGDNPNQVGAPTLNKPYSNPGWGAKQPQPKAPVNLTVTGKGTPYNNPGWGAGTLAQLMASMGQQQGANPGMEGNGAFGNVPMASGIPAQLPPADGSVALPKWKGAAVAPPAVSPRQSKLPFSGWDGAQHNGASTFEPRYSSGGYLFDAGGVQIGRDPKGVIPQTYQGTPQAAAAAAARERLTGGDGMDRSAAGDSFTGPYGSGPGDYRWDKPRTTTPVSPGTGSAAPRFRR